jgi:hypothetical protein
MKTEAARETDATSPGAARGTGRGVALKAPGHHMPAVTRRRPGGSIGAVYGPGAMATEITKGAIFQNKSTYLYPKDGNRQKRAGRIDVESLKGDRNFSPAGAGAAAAKPAAAAGAGAGAKVPAAKPATAGSGAGAKARATKPAAARSVAGAEAPD